MGRPLSMGWSRVHRTLKLLTWCVVWPHALCPCSCLQSRLIAYRSLTNFLAPWRPLWSPRGSSWVTMSLCL